MREFFIRLLDSGEDHAIEITSFSVWHFAYLLVIFGCIIGASFILAKKSKKTKTKVLNAIAIVTLVIYILDFFFQPLYTSNNQMDIDKLPFHICTLMGIVIVFAQFTKKHTWLKEVSVPLALAGALMYITYPNSALGGITPWCYKVVQTFTFHGLLLAWGVLSLTTKSVQLHWKNIWRHFVAIIVIALWATVGNLLYTNPSHHYDWFFLTGSTFPFVPTWLMPILVIIAIFTMVVIFYSLNCLGLKMAENYKNKKESQPEKDVEEIKSTKSEKIITSAKTNNTKTTTKK